MDEIRQLALSLAAALPTTAGQPAGEIVKAAAAFERYLREGVPDEK